MYNGQFAKGIAHLAVFAVLISLSDNVNGIFGFFAAGWIFYMSFEAYHTAVARRDGLPLPNAFGFNDIGERMGFPKSWGTVNPVRACCRRRPTRSRKPRSANERSRSQRYAPVNPVPVGTAPDWVGYVPPSAFVAQPATPEANAAAAMTAQIRAQAMQRLWSRSCTLCRNLHGRHAALRCSRHVPGSGRAVYHRPSIPYRRYLAHRPRRTDPSRESAARLEMTAQWWPPILLAGLSVWMFTRRLHSGARLVCIIRWPVILMVLAILLTLHAAYVPITIGLAGAILLITFGALLLLERAAGAVPPATQPIDTSPYFGTPYTVAPDGTVQGGEPTARAAWGAPDNEVIHDPTNKGGQ